MQTAITALAHRIRIAAILKRNVGSDDFLLPQKAPVLHAEAGGIERRRHARRKTLLTGRVLDRHGQTLFNCQVSDLSISGARLAFPALTLLPEIFSLKLSNGHSRRVRRVRQYVTGSAALEIGVAFL